MISLQRAIWKSSRSGSWLLLGLNFLVASHTSGAAESELQVEPSPPLWDRLGPSVSLRAAYWNRDRSYRSERNYLASSAWLTLRPEPVWGVRAVVEGYVGKTDTLGGASILSELREAYLEKSIGDFDLRVGRQMIVWGRADKVNPTDVWTSRDFTFLSSDDEDQRLGALGLNLVWNRDEWRVSGVVQPEWRFPVYPIPPISGVTLRNLMPDRRNEQFGIKVDRQSSEWDGSVSFARVISKVPSLLLLGAGAQGASVGLQFEPISMWGADFATTLGGWGLRGEAAYTLAPDRDGSQATQWNRELFIVLGAEHSPLENLTINFQGLYKHVFDFRNHQSWTDSNTQNLALQQNLVANQLLQNQWGVSIRPSTKFWNDTLELECAYVQWFGVPGGLVRPKGTYAVNDHLKVMLGSESYFGDSNSFLGRLAPISSFFTEFRYSF